jgi:hypothetical protein
MDTHTEQQPNQINPLTEAKPVILALADAGAGSHSGCQRPLLRPKSTGSLRSWAAMT